MIKHIVIWKLKEFSNGCGREENAKLIQSRIEALKGKIPGMINLEVGVDFSRTDMSGDVVLYSEFESREALDAYQIHPEHKKIMPFILEVREERHIVDYEV